jgi:PAS domain S-box-containing protein
MQGNIMAKSNGELVAENEELRRSLDESRELLRAISSGEVDALIVSRPEGEQVFTLKGADQAYRILIEAMNDGAVTMTLDGTILYCNHRFAEMVKLPLEKVIGTSFFHFIPQIDSPAFKSLMQRQSREELTLRTEDQGSLPVYISISSLQLAELKDTFCFVVTDLTDQKRNEEIVAAERLARSIIDQATEAIVVCDIKGKIIRYSKAVSTMLGRDPLLQSFDDLFDLYTPIGEKISPVLNALQGEIIMQSEANFERSDGLLFHIILNAGPLKGRNGTILGCVVALTDISEFKRAEKELIESEERYRLLFENGNDGIVLHELTAEGLPGDILEANDVMCRMLGYTEEEMIRLNAMDLQVEGSDEIWEDQKKILSHRNGILFERNLIAKDGRNIPVEFHTSIVNIQGRSMALSIIRDITERKLAEQERKLLAVELADRVAELRAVLDLAPVAVWIAHDPQCLRITGNRYADEVVMQVPRGANISASARPGEADVTFRVFRNGAEMKPEELPAQMAAATGKPVDAEVLELLFSSGRVVILLESAVPLFDAEGQVRGAVAAGAVVTDLKLAEEALQKSNEELEQKIQKRTAELVEAKNAAEDALALKAAFMANMSHELRTPMNSVIGFTSLLLLDEQLTYEQKDYLEIIRNSGESLLALINEVLDFSKLEREKTELDLQSFDLRTIVEESLDLVSTKAAEKDLELICTFGKGAPESIIGDLGKLRQVIGNLLSNAVKFTKEGEVEVDVTSDPALRGVHVAVRDTGIGIPQEDMGKIFQPFIQGDMSFKRGYEGTGLGLSISKKLVELMGGRIWVESEEGKGSTFHFTIPVETAPSNPKPSPDGFKDKRALIAVGNQTLRRVLGRQVLAWGIMPMMTETTQEAARLLQRDRNFDVVIIDASLDDAVYKMAAKRDQLKMPFIALEPLGHKVPPNLFQAILTKPFKPALLFHALEDVLEKNEASEPAEITKTDENYGGSLRILLAEDNLSNQKFTLQMLKKLGYRADAVVNGQEVLESLERQPYDLIFMDVKMPVMDGLEATRKIRELWPENGPKIIAITAYALHGDHEKCFASGMDGYISKPVRKEDLAKVLEKYKANEA